MSWLCACLSRRCCATVFRWISCAVLFRYLHPLKSILHLECRNADNDRPTQRQQKRQKRTSMRPTRTSAATLLAAITRAASRRMIRPCQRICSRRDTWAIKSTVPLCTMSLRLYSSHEGEPCGNITMEIFCKRVFGIQRMIQAVVLCLCDVVEQIWTCLLE
jgi:hypothetical protein